MEMKRPKPKDVVPIEKIIHYCENHMESLEDGSYDDDSELYLFEAILETVYGEGVWTWVNSKLK